VTHIGYLAAGYGITFAALAGYAAWVVGRRRALTRELPAETEAPDHPWR
jgi:heme exporter protein CcmD